MKEKEWADYRVSYLITPQDKKEKERLGFVWVEVLEDAGSNMPLDELLSEIKKKEQEGFDHDPINTTDRFDGEFTQRIVLIEDCGGKEVWEDKEINWENLN